MSYLNNAPTAAIVTALACLCPNTCSIAAETEDIKAALTSEVSISDLHGIELDVLPRGKPFNITISIDNAMGNEPPAGLYLNGWLRQRSEKNLDCQAAARAYLATGRTPIGSVELNGAVIGVLTEAGHLTIVDPEIDLATANLTGATSFDELPSAFTSDSETNRFLVSLGEVGEVVSVHTFGAERITLANGLDKPGTLIPAANGAVWVHERGSGDLLRLGSDGLIERMALDVEAISLGGNGRSLLIRTDDQVRVLNRRDPQALSSLTMQNIAIENSLMPLLDAVAIEDERGAFAVALLAESTIAIHYLDAPENAIQIEIDKRVERIRIDPSGRFLFGYSPSGGDTHIIDVARSRLAQLVGAGSAVTEIAFTDNAAFLMLSDQSMVGVIELTSIRVGQHAKVREIALGQPATSQKPNVRLLTSLAPRNEMLAIHSGSFTGFVIHESSVMGDAPPMSAIKLRGGVPHQVETLDRSFREVTTGTFQTTAMLPSSGQYELVFTTGIGSLSACMPLAIEGTDGINDLQPGSISVLGASRLEAWLEGARMRLHKADGKPAADIQAEITFAALEANWLLRARLETDDQGVSIERYDLPPLGEYVVTVTTASSQEFKPLVMQVEH